MIASVRPATTLPSPAGGSNPPGPASATAVRSCPAGSSDGIAAAGRGPARPASWPRAPEQGRGVSRVGPRPTANPAGTRCRRARSSTWWATPRRSRSAGRHPGRVQLHLAHAAVTQSSSTRHRAHSSARRYVLFSVAVEPGRRAVDRTTAPPARPAGKPDPGRSPEPPPRSTASRASPRPAARRPATPRTATAAGPSLSTKHAPVAVASTAALQHPDRRDPAERQIGRERARPSRRPRDRTAVIRRHGSPPPVRRHRSWLTIASAAAATGPPPGGSSRTTRVPHPAAGTAPAGPTTPGRGTGHRASTRSQHRPATDRKRRLVPPAEPRAAPPASTTAAYVRPGRA